MSSLTSNRFRFQFSACTEYVVWHFGYYIILLYCAPYSVPSYLSSTIYNIMTTCNNTNQGRFLGRFGVYHHPPRSTEPINLRLQKVWLRVPGQDRLAAEDCALHIVILKVCRIGLQHIWRKMDPCIQSDPSPHNYWLIVNIASRGVCPTSPSPISLVVALCTSLGLRFHGGRSTSSLVWRSWHDRYRQRLLAPVGCVWCEHLA